MTSQINSIANIDTAYPISGQDNDSQGFRDNFTSIDTKFSQADIEISDLQNRSLFNSDENNDPIVNDLKLSTISNGLYKTFFGVTRNAGEIQSGTTDIDLENGHLQLFTLTSNATLRFSNWPADGQFAKVRVHLKSNGSGTWIPTLSTENGGDLFYVGGFPSLALDPTGASAIRKQKVIEAWTFNAGATVFVRYLGEYGPTIDNTSKVEKLEVSGSSVFNGVTKFPVFANTTARDVAIPTPSAGMVVFVTSILKLQVHNGSAWTDLN